MRPETVKKKDEIITFSLEAESVIEDLPDHLKKLIAEELVLVYGATLRFAEKIALQTYIHVSEFRALSHIVRERSLFIIANMVFFIRIDASDFSWHIEKIDKRDPRGWCSVVEIK